MHGSAAKPNLTHKMHRICAQISTKIKEAEEGGGLVPARSKHQYSKGGINKEFITPSSFVQPGDMGNTEFITGTEYRQVKQGL